MSNLLIVVVTSLHRVSLDYLDKFTALLLLCSDVTTALGQVSSYLPLVYDLSVFLQ